MRSLNDALTNGPTVEQAEALEAEFQQELADIEGSAASDVALTEVTVVLKERAIEVDSRGTYPHENIKTLREAGLLGICLPKKFGGLGKK